MRVFISAAYTKGDVAANVRRAMDIWEELHSLGHIGFLPHLMHFLNLVHPHSYQEWMDYDSSWLEACDCLLRVPGESAGADLEVKIACELGIPVFYSIAELEKWDKEQDERLGKILRSVTSKDILERGLKESFPGVSFLDCVTPTDGKGISRSLKNS
jgi:hypothetical protein